MRQVLVDLGLAMPCFITNLAVLLGGGMYAISFAVRVSQPREKEGMTPAESIISRMDRNAGIDTPSLHGHNPPFLNTWSFPPPSP